MMIKRRYLDLRNGWQVIGPIFGFSNFLMIAYLTFVNELMPLETFAIIFTPIMVIGLVGIGFTFRRKQLSTDMNLNYEKATQAATTVYYQMLSNLEIMKKLDMKIPEGYEERLEYMRKIANSEKDPNSEKKD